MEDLTLTNSLVTIAGALLLGIAAIFGIGWFLTLQRRMGQLLLASIFPVIFIAICISTALSGRIVTNAEFEIASVTGVESGLTTWLMRLATVYVLCVCLARLVSVSQSMEKRSGDGRTLFLAFLAFSICTMALNNMFGTVPNFNQQFIYPALVFITFYFSRDRGSDFAVDGMKVGLFIYLLASCAALVALPAIALQRDYTGIIPKLNIRMWGLGSNPNSIGPLAVIFLLLLYYKPFVSRLVQYPAVVTGLLVLLLSQSKTAWISAIIAFPIVWYGHLIHTSGAGGGGASSAYRLRNFSGPILVGVLGLAGAVAGSLYFLFSSEIAAVTGKEEVTTLTGRTEIWRVALETWQQSPVFGYGSTMWDEAFRTRIGMNFAFNAHNQFMETLSISGAVGLAALVVYLLVTLRYCFAANKATKGLSLALFAFLLARCFTETPFNMSTLFSGEYMTHLLVYTLILNKGRQRQSVNQAAVSYPLHQMQYR